MVVSHHDEIESICDFLFGKLRHVIPFILTFRRVLAAFVRGPVCDVCCQIGRDESYDESAFLWEEGAELNLSNVRLGQLVGPIHDADQIDTEDSELAESALFTLTREERPIICRALVAAHGGAGQLAESLFATSLPEGDEDIDDDADEEEAPRDLFDESPNDAARVVVWITNGMPRL